MKTMIYQTPLIEFGSELYKMLSDPDEIGFQVFDSGIAVEDILAQFRDLEHTKFAVISDISCTQTHTKTDTIIWNLSVRLELVSTYKGRLRVAEMMHEIGSAVTKNEEAFDMNLKATGYTVIKTNIGDLNIGPSTHDGGLTWQTGSININYWIGQLDDFTD